MAQIDLSEYISARTNMTKRFVRDAIDSRYIKVGKTIATGYKLDADQVRKSEIVIDFPKFKLKPESERVNYPRGVRGSA